MGQLTYLYGSFSLTNRMVVDNAKNALSFVLIVTFSRIMGSVLLIIIYVENLDVRE